MQKKVLIICPFPENTVPGQRLKYEQYFNHWRENGFQLTIKPFVSSSFMKIIYSPGKFHIKIFHTLIGYINRLLCLFSLKKYDVVYIFLWVTPFGIPFFEWLYCAISRKVIYDIDDLVYLHHTSKANALFSFLKGRNKPIYLMKKAHHVITCTPKLDAFVRKYNQHTTDISSTVDTEIRYLPVNSYKNDHRIVLGWSGSHSTSKYLLLLESVLQELALEVDYELIVMGDATFKLNNINITVYPWSDTHEIEVLQKFDIGLYPLPDEEWVYGKSGLKAIQYMALGIPTVATAIGANYRVIEHEQDGFLIPVNEFNMWKNTLLRLIKDVHLREKIGKNARKKIVNHFSISANNKTYLQILNSQVE